MEITESFRGMTAADRNAQQIYLQVCEICWSNSQTRSRYEGTETASFFKRICILSEFH